MKKLKKIGTWFDKIGVEIEGGWEGYSFEEDDDGQRNLPEGFHEDGSVDVGLEVQGECVSKPFAYVEQVKSWLRSFYPDEVNSTCGFHVHMSLHPWAYVKLLDGKFKDKYNYLEFLVQELKVWGKKAKIRNPEFWSRLDGHNTYCELDWMPERQLANMSKGEARYCAVNFCYGFHGTVEIRVLPAFKHAETACSSLQALIDITKRFLRQASEPEGEIGFEVEEPSAEELNQTLEPVCAEDQELVERLGGFETSPAIQWVTQEEVDRFYLTGRFNP